MSGAWASLIAVAGTLLGALAAHFFQQRANDRAEGLQRQRHLLGEKLDAYSAFASAVVAYRRGQYGPRNPKDDMPTRAAAQQESFRLRMVAQQALFRVALVTEDRSLVELAERSLEATKAISDDAELGVSVSEAKAALNLFVEVAGRHVRLNARPAPLQHVGRLRTLSPKEQGFRFTEDAG